MVDQDDGQAPQARPPSVEDLIDLCRRLNQEGTRYIVIGGMAVIQAGFVRATEDIDLLVDTAPDNIACVRRALMALPDQAIREMAGALERWETLPAQRDELLKQLAAEGDTTAAAEQATLAEERRELARQRDALGQDQRRVDLAELDSEYRELDGRRVQLKDAYTRAFDSAKQSEAADALLAHLRRLHENRLAAQKLGSNTAARQAAKIKAEMDRVRRQ